MSLPFLDPPALEWIRDMRVAVTIRHSSWMLPAIESAHLLAYAGVIGSAAAIDFRILRIGLRRQTAAGIAAMVAPWTAASLALSVATGALMFTYKPMQFAANRAFPVKLGLVAAAIVFHYAAVTRAARREPATGSAKIVAAASLALWLVVVLAGMAVSLELF